MTSFQGINLVEQRVALARRGENPFSICRLASGWLVAADRQPQCGCCLLLADPVVESLQALTEAERIAYFLDLSRIGDALTTVTGAYRINYETLGNQAAALHTHITPRYRGEPVLMRRMSPSVSRFLARRFDKRVDGAFVEQMRTALAGVSI